MNIESQHQITVINYLRVRYPDVLFNISPANTINPWHGKQNKRMGLQKGCPDIMIFKTSTWGGEINHCGLFIELKRPERRDFTGKVFQTKGRSSPEQLIWQLKLNKEGYLAVTCFGATEACDLIDKYMENKL